MKLNIYIKPVFVLILIMVITTLPWLGLTDFNTKGEPREAIVAQTMLMQDNWVLPTNNGGEMAYKPPFFHWCVAAVSAVFGNVGEYSSRFPSAVASIVLVLWMFLFYSKDEKEKNNKPLFATLICFTTFEVFRGAYACRVDMVLTLCIVGAMFAFFSWSEKKNRGVPWFPILMMSLGTLTKGPVAIILPCATIGLYMLLRRENIFRTFFSLVGCGIVSLILPACWYYAAYRQGGSEFLELVREENVDRFLGKMSYSSHENGLWYYFAMLPAGLLPWSLFSIPVLWRCFRKVYTGKIKTPSMNGVRMRIQSLQEANRMELFSAIAAILVFVFYCIPKSKRGVYILPMYPFVCYFIASWLMKFYDDKILKRITCVVIAVYLIAYSAIVPSVLNKKSDIQTARYIESVVQDAYLTSHITEEASNNPLHFFTINFYLNDRVDVWRKNGPKSDEGYIIIGEKDAPGFMSRNASYDFTKVEIPPHKSCDIKQVIELYHYQPARSISR